MRERTPPNEGEHQPFYLRLGFAESRAAGLFSGGAGISWENATLIEWFLSAVLDQRTRLFAGMGNLAVNAQGQKGQAALAL
ncbi:hypothetical protein POX_a00700 [Penicillium oxalicum]|uniref:Uncharacterized protein n=1 Tax=Penicillium oxalicum (strain 114-2 / CGMCC 5302) TaxID=933388 RepID=S8B646_PENO1|nr:hypothetical protein POX_a00700 [Penicillium oxalicum]EPS34328.1 hypothetical protein PDE_09292 [Penicillium oxalicum 114-2]KAI2794110.1 hypothetical protein POX_a00700 [Penicillium oxalicum]